MKGFLQIGNIRRLVAELFGPSTQRSNLLYWRLTNFKTLPEGAQVFPYQMSKIFHICKRIFFAISNFAIIEEVTFYLKDGWLYVLLLFLTLKYQEVIHNPFEFKSYSKLQNCVWSGNCTIAVSPSHFESCVNFANAALKVPTANRFSSKSNN